MEPSFSDAISSLLGEFTETLQRAVTRTANEIAREVEGRVREYVMETARRRRR